MCEERSLAYLKLVRFNKQTDGLFGVSVDSPGGIARVLRWDGGQTLLEITSQRLLIRSQTPSVTLCKKNRALIWLKRSETNRTVA